MKHHGLALFLPGYLDEALKPPGVTFFEYSTLSALSHADDRTLPMTSLAHLANGSLSRMSHTTRRLEQRGRVRRSPCPDDRRVTLVSLTEQGYRTLVDVAPIHVESLRRAVFDVLAPEQVPHLGGICRASSRPSTPAVHPRTAGEPAAVHHRQGSRRVPAWAAGSASDRGEPPVLTAHPVRTLRGGPVLADSA